MKLKVGDIVRYMSHVFKSDSCYFTIGNVYKITKVQNESEYILNKITLYVVSGQIEKMYDTKLNRVLYPEYFEVKDD
jgi:hypothetical protein